MMNESAFADAVLANAENALAEYNLPEADVAKFKSMSRADFEAFASASPEDRKSFSLNHNVLWGDYVYRDFGGEA